MALSERRRALLAALVVADRPIGRTELVQAVGIGRSSLNSMLSRLATEDLGLTSPIHRQVDRHRGLIELDRGLVNSDVDDIRRILDSPTPLDGAGALALADHQAFRRPAPTGLVTGTPLSREVSGILQDLSRRAAVSLGTAGLAGLVSEWPLAHSDPADFNEPELVAAHIDHLVRSEGNAAARRALDTLVRRRASTSGAQLDLAHLVIATAETAANPGQRSRRPRRRIDGIVRALKEGEARVLTMRHDGVGPDAIVGMVDALRDRLPAVIGRWVSAELSPAAAVAAIVADVVSDQIRRPGGLRPRLVAALAAVADDRPLEPGSTARWFARDTAAALRIWAGGDETVLVVGRSAAPAPDLDRILADLLRLEPNLRLLIICPDSNSDPDSSSDLDLEGLLDFPVTAIDLPASWATKGHQPTAEPEGGERRRLQAVVAHATDQGQVHEELAQHLLDLVGVTASPDDLLPIDPRLGLLDPIDADAPLSPGDQRWLNTAAIRWLLDGRLGNDRDLAVLRRLVGRLPAHPVATESVLAGLPAALSGPADLAVSHGDHRFALALIDLALDHARDPGRPTLLLRRGDIHRDIGRWDLAMNDYLEAADLLAAEDRSEPTAFAELALRAARLTWDPDTGERVDQILAEALAQLPPGEPIWRARVELGRAGGSFQDGSAGTDRISAARIEAALETASTALDPTARAWAFVHARKALLGVADVDTSHRWAERVVEEAQLDVAVLAHGHQALFVDSVRRGRWAAAEQALRNIDRLARTPTSAEQQFSAIVAQTCWDLQIGRLVEAEAGLAAEQTFGARLGGSTFTQVTLAQSIWLARTRGDRAELEGLAGAAAAMADSEPGGEIWMAGATLLATDVGQYRAAAERAVGFARRVGGFDQLRPGAHRLGVLAISAWAAGLAAANEPESPFTQKDLVVLIDGLATTNASVVLIGWPTVILGPVARFRGMALAAAGRLDAAESALAIATVLDSGMAPMKAQAVKANEALACLRST